MRNALFLLSILFHAPVTFAGEDGESFVAAGLALVGKNPEVARDMLLKGVATAPNPPAKAYLELAKLSENDKDFAVNLYLTAYRMSIQDPKAQADCKFIVSRLQIISKPTADLIIAMGSYAVDLDTIQRTRKDELTQSVADERWTQLRLSDYAVTSKPVTPAFDFIGHYRWEQPDAGGTMELLAGGTFTRKDTRYSRTGKGTWKVEGKALVITSENWTPEKLDFDGPGKFKGPHHKGGFITMEKVNVQVKAGASR